MFRPRRILPQRHRQRGSILAPAVIGLFAVVVLLGGVQLGYLFYVKRDMQKAADLAALSGAQALGNGNALDCAAATTAAAAAARANLPAPADAANVSADCWRWDPVNNDADPRHLAAPTAGQRFNAVMATIDRAIPSLVPFMEDRTVGVQAVAARPGEPVAAFSIGTTLLASRQRPGTLVNLLAAVGLDLDSAKLVGYDAGLADVRITPAGLLHRLGIDVASDITVGQLNSLLAANRVSLNDLLDAVVVAGGQGGLLAANVTLVNAVKSQLGLDALNVALGSDSAGRGGGLFAEITAPDAQSALNTRIGALDLIAAAVGVATGGHAVQGGAPVDIAGLVTVTPSFSIVEPAQIAIGGVGATAYSAQVRVFLRVTVPTIKLLGLLSFGIDLPIVADLVAGQGTLTDLCTETDSSGRDLATIAVKTSVLDACIGDLTQESAFSSKQPCGTDLHDHQLLTLKVFDVDMGVNNHIPLPLIKGEATVTLYAGQKVPVPTKPSLQLGNEVKDLTDAALTFLLGHVAQKGGDTQSGDAASSLAKGFWAQARDGNKCNPNAGGADGYNCRNDLWQSALKLAQQASAGLGDYLDKQPNAGLLTGVANLLTGLTGALDKALSDIVGALVPTNACATFTLLPLGYGGTESGCVGEIAKRFAGKPNAGAALSNVVLGLLGPLFDALRPALDAIGDALLDVVNNEVGLDLNRVDVNLMSLQCNGKGVQLVF
ncbi:hypothetical protein CAL29_20835 [Bordetella genomosp. 10]|uniref:DUF2134 domain-containing protein n=1 Tax=Bordetella genomosp. 10 TaxID=1416804 RepID=A0A261RZF0_9BORD|nr:TadG family pilus assembly protein [Bordetella genomosp. 10]OZI30474.1 hypothetical protein CAL29_20835 [Bordetella genomosp. 10]